MSLIESLQQRGFLKSARMVAVSQYLFRNGFKATIARYGWRLLVFVFLCYLVRDVFLYVVIPWWVARSIQGH